MSLAKTLPEKLQRFLARYPAPQVLGVGAPKTHTGYQTDTRNPFRPHFHEATRRWHNPVYSARRQADLVKLARAHGVEELLPSTPKNTETRLAKKVALGSRIKGTGVGQRVKGRIHERMLAVKYVLVRDGGGVACESRARWAFADVVVQDGQEERGHAQDAGAHQRLEGGKFQLGVLVGFRSSANAHYRLEGRTGPSGRNKGSHSHDGLSIAVQLYIERVHQNHNIHVKHTMPGTRPLLRMSLQLVKFAYQFGGCPRWAPPRVTLLYNRLGHHQPEESNSQPCHPTPCLLCRCSPVTGNIIPMLHRGPQIPG